MASDKEGSNSRSWTAFANGTDTISFRVNVTVQVDTEWIQNFLFPAQAHIIWPTLLNDGNRLRFPVTQIGNLSVSLMIRNHRMAPRLY